MCCICFFVDNNFMLIHEKVNPHLAQLVETKFIVSMYHDLKRPVLQFTLHQPYGGNN